VDEKVEQTLGLLISSMNNLPKVKATNSIDKNLDVVPFYDYDNRNHPALFLISLLPCDKNPIQVLYTHNPADGAIIYIHSEEKVGAHIRDINNQTERNDGMRYLELLPENILLVILSYVGVKDIFRNVKPVSMYFSKLGVYFINMFGKFQYYSNSRPMISCTCIVKESGTHD
jgi:hypothetical protein